MTTKLVEGTVDVWNQELGNSSFDDIFDEFDDKKVRVTIETIEEAEPANEELPEEQKSYAISDYELDEPDEYDPDEYEEPCDCSACVPERPTLKNRMTVEEWNDFVQNGYWEDDSATLKPSFLVYGQFMRTRVNIDGRKYDVNGWAPPCGEAYIETKLVEDNDYDHKGCC